MGNHGIAPNAALYSIYVKNKYSLGTMSEANASCPVMAPRKFYETGLFSIQKKENPIMAAAFVGFFLRANLYNTDAA